MPGGPHDARDYENLPETAVTWSERDRRTAEGVTAAMCHVTFLNWFGI